MRQLFSSTEWLLHMNWHFVGIWMGSSSTIVIKCPVDSWNICWEFLSGSCLSKLTILWSTSNSKATDSGFLICSHACWWRCALTQSAEWLLHMNWHFVSFWMGTSSTIVIISPVDSWNISWEFLSWSCFQINSWGIYNHQCCYQNFKGFHFFIYIIYIVLNEC